MSRRPLDELLAADDGWSGYVHGLFGTAEIVPTTEARGRAALWEMQVTQASSLGAMALHCAAVRVDGGWLTLLGAGDPATGLAGLPEWNGTSEAVPLLVRRGFVVIGYDAVGGFFALDGGGIRKPTHNVAYLDPSSARWEDLGLSYSDWLAWAGSDRVAAFYADLRWPVWEAEVAALHPGQGLSLYPPLWSREGKNPAQSDHAAVPIYELWGLAQDAERLFRR